MTTAFLLSSDFSDKILGEIIQIRGRIYHTEISEDEKKSYFYIRDDLGLIMAIFEIVNFPEVDKIPLETFIIITGVLNKSDQPSLTKYYLISQSYELISPPSEDIEPLRPVLSSIRFLYIRRLEIKNLLIIKRYIRKYAINFLESQGFQPVETPVITSFTQINRQAMRVNTNRQNGMSERDKFLIQKSQFYLEAFAHTFGKVYTLTPAFRADHRESDLLLAEFWLLEVEEILSSIEQKMDLLEALIKFVCAKLLFNHEKDLRELLIFREISKMNLKNLKIHELGEEFWSKIDNKQLEQKEFLKKVINNRYPRLKYKDIVNEFEDKGDYIETTHLREKRAKYLTDKYNNPVFVIEFPFEKRHFYDKKIPGDENYTLTFDLLGHGNYGEIASGSEREYRADIIEEQMFQKRLRKENNQTLQWYYKLQKFGSVPHAGFSIGLERLTAWLTQTQNITDTIGFPRRVKGTDINY